MPYNGTGIFQRLYSWVADAANGIKISSTEMDAEMDGMATALSNCMTRDGQSPALGDIPMGGKKITGLANGVAANDAATVGQLPAVAPPSPTRSAVSAAAGVAQTGIANALTKILFGNLIADTLGEFSVANSRFTATQAGNYLVNASIEMFASTLNAFCAVNINKNASPAFGIGGRSPTANRDFVMPITGIVFLNPGEYIELWAVFQAGTGNALHNVAGLGGFSQLTIVRVG